MLPHYLTIGNFSLPTYGLMVALAFLAAVTLASKLGRRVGLNGEAIINLGIYCAIAGVIGARLMLLIVDLPHYISDPADIISIGTLRAGGVFYGGLLAALGTAWWYMRRHKLPTFRTADVMAPALALGHAIGRLGCFSAGCCWGVECHLPWAVTFTNPAANDITGVPLNVPLHPTQLYESFSEFAIFAFLLWRFRKPHADGAIISLYLMLYATVRFLVEFVRFHEQGNLWGTPLDASQWISLGLFALGVIWWRRVRRRPVLDPCLAAGVPGKR